MHIMRLRPCPHAPEGEAWHRIAPPRAIEGSRYVLDTVCAPCMTEAVCSARVPFRRAAGLAALSPPKEAHRFRWIASAPRY